MFTPASKWLTHTLAPVTRIISCQSRHIYTPKLTLCHGERTFRPTYTERRKKFEGVCVSCRGRWHSESQTMDPLDLDDFKVLTSEWGPNQISTDIWKHVIWLTSSLEKEEPPQPQTGPHVSYTHTLFRHSAGRGIPGNSLSSPCNFLFSLLFSFGVMKADPCDPNPRWEISTSYFCTLVVEKVLISQYKYHSDNIQQLQFTLLDMYRYCRFTSWEKPKVTFLPLSHGQLAGNVWKTQILTFQMGFYQNRPRTKMPCERKETCK